ncbi:alpha/beta family hydrolase [Nakamurella sp. PAMC28650]|uniref:alpha/beta hydrolase family protein n=1 Tax=Nakamurella sp. PAMC28650 TaxID=2762325 RepID=UPI001C9AFFE9|nr:alpha/beta family hydrolase [Nakamurella sp. PAMC28650]
MEPAPVHGVPGALLLAPGAGATRDHHTLVAVQDEVAPLPCLRMDFPYRLAAKLGLSPGRLVLGGRSYGGRMCSMAVAQGLPAAGLVLLSYPLHPPGKPERLRVDHFPRIDVPVLFVSGDRDPFGSPAEFAEQIQRIPGPVTQVWVPGAHDPRGADALVAAAVRSWLVSLGVDDER